MMNSRCPLQEKMALFWHHVFATGLGKNQHILASTNQIDMLRRVGMGKIRDLLLELSKDPAMIFWLDNNENRKGEPNENYGRELLELFSLGVGNYSEDDIKSCARAFTGWTFGQPIPLYPHGYYSPPFLFVEEEHDDGEENLLGTYRQISTVMTSLTSSPSNPLVPDSSPDTSTISLSQMSHRYRRGT